LERYADTEEVDPFLESLREDGSDRVAHFLEYQGEKVEHGAKVKSFKTGLFKLDEYVEGFETGEVTVISGPTGNGKTLFADSLGQRLMRLEKMNIAWFSYEVPTQKMIQKYVSAYDSTELGLYVPMELKTGNVEWLKKKCLEAQLKYNCQAVFIDHIHFLVDMATKQNMSLNIGGVMRQIKHDIAKAMNIMVFIICHQGQPKEDEPSIENIRDSSFIGQESDNVFIVYRLPDPLPEELKQNGKIKGYPRTYDNGLAVVKVEKARRAGTYRKKIIFKKQDHWLEEYEENI
jgi:replicative DNA helicase